MCYANKFISYVNFHDGKSLILCTYFSELMLRRWNVQTFHALTLLISVLFEKGMVSLHGEKEQVCFINPQGL